jgi:hypothetical protein
MKRHVPAPGINSHHPDAGIVKPAGGLGRDAAAFKKIIGRMIINIPAGVDQDNIVRF